MSELTRALSKKFDAEASHDLSLSCLRTGLPVLIRT